MMHNIACHDVTDIEEKRRDAIFDTLPPRASLPAELSLPGRADQDER